MLNKQKQVIKFYKEYYQKEAEREGHGKVWINNRVEKVINEMDQIYQVIEKEIKVKEIVIFISWTKSNACKATVKVYKTQGHDEYNTTAGGYGYDKISSAVGQALNEDITALAMIYKMHAQDKKGMPYGIDDLKGGLSFGQGVGMSCYRNITKWLGGEFYQQYNDENGNYFYRMTF